jgi:hypothetical protein
MSKPVAIEEYLGVRVVDVQEHRDSGDRRHKREQQTLRDGGEPCAMCGRKLGDGTTTFDIACCGGGLDLLAPHAEADRLAEEDRGWMGGWRVGPDCGARLRKAIKAAGLDPDLYVCKSQA